MSGRTLAVALHAVATSRAMPDNELYKARVEALRPMAERTNPPAHELARRFVSTCPDELAVDPSLRASELLAALSSFVDDYRSAAPRECFRVELAVGLLRALEGRSALTVVDQLSLGLTLSSKVFDVVLALHVVTRVLARGRDRRLHPAFDLDLEERLRRGRAIAPFAAEDSEGGDPLGDTYHFWANVAGGMYAGVGEARRSPRWFVAGMLYAGPWLMAGIRERTFGNRLFYGTHEKIDRMGLRIGYRLGVRARS
ncbi:MAG: hypothetical protein AAGF12_13325 [Myxococcota bacterium]